MLKIIECAEWGASPKNSAGLRKRTAVGIVLHHTASPNTQVLENGPAERRRCFELARSIQRSHLRRRFRDSGHHFLVTRSGTILEGRHDSFATAQQGMVIHGSHAGDNWANTKMHGIECEGIYIDEEPPEALWNALVDLCAHLAWWGGFQSGEIEGHRIYRATQCPGEILFRKLPELRTAVHNRKVVLMAEGEDR